MKDHDSFGRTCVTRFIVVILNSFGFMNPLKTKTSRIMHLFFKSFLKMQRINTKCKTAWKMILDHTEALKIALPLILYAINEIGYISEGNICTTGKYKKSIKTINKRKKNKQDYSVIKMPIQVISLA